MLATIFNRAAHRAHASISIPNTRFSRYAQRIATWRGSADRPDRSHRSAPCAGLAVPPARWLPLPRPAGVISARRLLLGASTPW